MRKAVFDTNTLVKLYFDEPIKIPPEAEPLLEAAKNGNAIVYIPHFARVEFHNVVVCIKEMMPDPPKMSQAAIDHILAEFYRLPLEVVPDEELLGAAKALTRKWDLYIYDALFMALAIRENAELLTTDYELGNAWEAYHGRAERLVVPAHKIRGKFPDKPPRSSH